MSCDKILILTGYDYSDCFNVLSDYEYTVLVPENESLLDAHSKQRLKSVLDDKYLEMNYKDVSEYVVSERPDILITFGWRRILPDEVIEAAKYAINIHPAILPEYKGYHPVPHVLINNEKQHGITAHLIDSELDSGDIVHQETFPIDKFSTLKDLQTEVNARMPDFIKELCRKVVQGDFELQVNNSEKNKVIAGKRTPEDSEIDLNMTVKEAYDHIRACDEERFPAYIVIDGQKVILKIEKD